LITEIEKMEMPIWLSSDDFEFNVNDVLKDSLYYPASGFDFSPVKEFMGNIFSFFYVDYGKERTELLNVLKDEYKNFKGYKIIHQQKITQNDLAPNGWTVNINPTRQDGNYRNSMNVNTNKSFCEWIIFERDENIDDVHNPKRFSFLYLYGDGAASFQAAYLSNDIKPKIVAVIQPGHGFGLNWTNFTDRQQIFARSVLYNKNLVPDYLLIGGMGEVEYYMKPMWEEYSKNLWVSDHSSLTLWEKQ